MKQWEYTLLPTDPLTLTQWGLYGWEACGVVPVDVDSTRLRKPVRCHVLMKREFQPPAPPAESK